LKSWRAVVTPGGRRHPRRTRAKCSRGRGAGRCGGDARRSAVRILCERVHGHVAEPVPTAARPDPPRGRFEEPLAEPRPVPVAAQRPPQPREGRLRGQPLGGGRRARLTRRRPERRARPAAWRPPAAGPRPGASRVGVILVAPALAQQPQRGVEELRSSTSRRSTAPASEVRRSGLDSIRNDPLNSARKSVHSSPMTRLLRGRDDVSTTRSYHTSAQARHPLFVVSAE
jgi:hypothetical protein